MFRVDPLAVLSVATYVQGQDHIPSFILKTQKYPLKRGFYSIYALQYPDGSRCAVKIPIYMAHKTPQEQSVIAATVDEEIATLEYLSNKKFAWSPKAITYSSNFQNPLEFPYMILTWMNGDSLEWNERMPHTLKIRESVLKQVAYIMLDLAMVTEEREFILDIIDQKTLGVIRHKLAGVNIIECMQLRKLAREALHIPNEVYSHPGECPEDCDHDSGNEKCMKNTNESCTGTSFALSHDDLSAENIMVDADYNVQGFCNWSYAKRLPMRFALRLPRFLSIESLKLEDTTKDLSSTIIRYLTPTPMMQHDRAAFAHHLTWALIQTIPGSAIAEAAPMACDIYDVDWKHLILIAAYRTRVHWWLAQRKWLLGATFAGMNGNLLDKEKGWDHDVPLEAYHFAERNIAEHGTGVRKQWALSNFKRSKGGQRLDWDYVFRWLYGHFKERDAVLEE